MATNTVSLLDIFEGPVPVPDSRSARDSLSPVRQEFDRLHTLEDDIRTCSAEIEQTDVRARQAVSNENTEEVAVAWQRKKSLQDRLEGLRRDREEARRSLQSEFESQLLVLRSELEARLDAMAQEHQRLTTKVQELTTSLSETTRELAGLPARVQEEQLLWETKVRELLREASPALLGSTGWGKPGQYQMRPPQWNLWAPGEAGAHQRECWSVYNVDTGKMVETLAELKQLLARWLPQVQSEEERISRFLSLSNTGPMPDSLRRELTESGYQVAD